MPRERTDWCGNRVTQPRSVVRLRKRRPSAVAHAKIAEVVNIARALETLKEAGVWTVGLASEADARYDQIDFTLPSALVVGAEGAGLRRLVRERCDWLVSIPMLGHVQSLNVSVAAGIVLSRGGPAAIGRPAEASSRGAIVRSTSEERISRGDLDGFTNVERRERQSGAR